MVQEFLLVIVYTIVRQIRLQNFLRQNSFVRIFSSSFREGKGAIVTPMIRFKVMSLQIYNKNLTPKLIPYLHVTVHKGTCFARAEHIFLPVG